MNGINRRRTLSEALEKNRTYFDHFQFDGKNKLTQDGSLLNDEDILIMSQIGFPQTQSIIYRYSHTYLENNSLTCASLKILVEAYPKAQQLQMCICPLNSANNPLKDEAVQYIIKLTQILSLKLRNTQLSVLGMKVLAGAQMKNLMQVHLNQNKIGSQGCRWISAANWPYLHSIFLTNCAIEDAGALHLSKTNWKALSELYLMDNRITHVGTFYLKRADWQHLKTLSVLNHGFKCWFRMIDFYPHAFSPTCNFNFRRLKRQQMMMSLSSRYHGCLPIQYD